jgi:hypothetical protein
MAPRKKSDTVTVLVMAANIYDTEGEKRFKRERFECSREFAEAIRAGDEEAGRELRLEIL